MNSVEAVRSVLTRPVLFTGRACRSEFWWFALFVLVVDVLASIIDVPLNSPVAEVIAGLLLLLPLISVSVRRLHDTERSGWWALVGMVPFIGPIWLLVLCAQAGNSGYNQYGPSPSQPAAAAGHL